MGKVDLDAIKAKYAQMSQKKTGGNSEDFLKNFAKLENGSNKVRILPPKDDKPFYAETKVHRVGSGDKVSNLHCLKIHGKDCPLCKAYYKLWDLHKASGAGFNDKTKFSEAARSLKPNSRYYINVAMIPTKEVKILSIGDKLYKKIIGAMVGVINEKTGELLSEGLGDITDPEVGHDLIVMLKQVGEYNNYDDSFFANKPTPIGTKKDLATMMDSLHDIHALVKVEDYDKLNEVAMTVLSAITGTSSNTSSSNETNHAADDDTDYLSKLRG